MYFSTFHSPKTTAEYHNYVSRIHPLAKLRDMRLTFPDDDWVLLFWSAIPLVVAGIGDHYWGHCADDNEGELLGEA